MKPLVLTLCAALAAVAVAVPAAFAIAWSHKAAHGGNVVEGNVHVRQISVS